MSEEVNKNMKLWDQVCETDPEITKDVKFGKKMTAICPQYQAKNATKIFGPYGMRWGLKDLNYQVVSNYHEVPLDESRKTNEVQGEYRKTKKKKDLNGKDLFLELVLDAVFWYQLDGEEGSFPISSDMKYEEGGECRKKLRTDCQSKALSFLGFNSDVFEGKFDDNKYVNEMRQKFKEPPVPKAKVKLTNDKFMEMRRYLENGGDMSVIEERIENYMYSASQLEDLKMLERAV